MVFRLGRLFIKIFFGGMGTKCRLSKRRLPKRQITKHRIKNRRILQNVDCYKTSLLQNVDYNKMLIVTKCYFVDCWVRLG